MPWSCWLLGQWTQGEKSWHHQHHPSYARFSDPGVAGRNVIKLEIDLPQFLWTTLFLCIIRKHFLSAFTFIQAQEGPLLGLWGYSFSQSEVGVALRCRPCISKTSVESSVLEKIGVTEGHSQTTRWSDTWAQLCANQSGEWDKEKKHENKYVCES